MKVYYDLGTSPPTFDIVAALCHVEQLRREADEQQIEFTFLPGPDNGFRRDRLWPPQHERNKLLWNVAVPLCWLLPSVSMVSVATTRPSSGIGVNRKLYGLDRQVEACRKGIRPLRSRHPVQRRHGLITMTLREAEHWPERNSNVGEWIKAAQELQRSGHRIMMVRDERNACSPLGTLPIDTEAARDIYARAELYASASLNLFMASGPAMMALAMDAPAVVFKRPSDAKLGLAFGQEHFARCGLPWLGQMPGAPAYQQLVWADDAAETIVAAVHEFIGSLAEAS
jgi:hypothetical protein